MKSVKEAVKRELSSEHDEQCALMMWKWLNISRLPELANLYAIPNGGARDAVTGAKLKAEGVVSGIPDLHLACARGIYAGLFIEMKVKPNKPTSKQLEVMENLRRQGYAAVVCYSASEAIAVIEDYLKGRPYCEIVRDVNEWAVQKYCVSEAKT